MPFSNGVFSITTSGTPYVTGTVISSAAANNVNADLATGLSTCMLKDGTQTITANIPMSGFKLTGLAAGTTAGNSVRYEQLFGAFLPITGGTLTGDLLFTDATYDIGKAGATRPRDIFASRNVTVGGTLTALQYASLRGLLSGATLSTAGGSGTMSIAAGAAQDSTNAYWMALASAFTKTTGAWAVGTGNGGKLSAAAAANNTVYHWFLIARTDTGVIDVGFDLSPTAPTMPTNYTLFRRIGSWLTDGSAQWRLIIQDGDEFNYSTPIQDVSTGNPGSSAVTATLASMPTGVRLEARISAGVIDTGTTDTAYFSDLSTADLAPSATASPGCTIISQVANRYAYVEWRGMTNTSAQVRYRVGTGGVNSTIKINTLGWIDTRGRNT